MKRFVVTGDWHFKLRPPKARTDDFASALRRKIVEVFEIAYGRDADAVIVPGDVFDSPSVALSTIGALACLLQDATMKVLTVPGNHDEFGANPETIARTPYGLLKALEFIRDVGDAPYDTWFNTGAPDRRLVVSGHGYDAYTDLDITQYLAPAYEPVVTRCIPNGFPADNVRVHVVHGMILERTPSFELRHTLLSEIAAHDDAPDVLIVGHEHTGFGVLRVPRPGKSEPMIAINPGALCRLTAHPAEIERTVQVCLLTVDDDGRIETELIPLQSARPGHEVLSREHLEAQAEREEKVAAFLALLAEEGETRFLEVREIIEDIARREAVPREVVDEALRRIGAAREALAKGEAA